MANTTSVPQSAKTTALPSQQPKRTTTDASKPKEIGDGVTVEIPPDKVNSPNHYVQGKRLELVDLLVDVPGWKFNAIKYIYRAGTKSGVEALEDISKARKYLDFGERLLKGEPISDTLRDQIRDWDNPGPVGE